MVDSKAVSPRQRISPVTVVLGLTGSIGMGKSTVASMFKRHGVPVSDADKIVHELYSKGGAAVAPVGHLYPSVITDGAVDRALLGKCVLGDKEAMVQLENIVHPLVAAQRNLFLQQVASQGRPLAVLDVPLLFESGGETHVDFVAVVGASPELQAGRVMARPGMSQGKFEAILARQMPDAEKRARADFVIDTSVSLEETEARVLSIIQELTSLV
ncbi:MAG: hypothetical protein WDW38_008721 [Sanguina aurantia]